MTSTKTDSCPFSDVKLFMDVCGDITKFEDLIDLEPHTKKFADAQGQVTRYVNLIEEEITELQEATTRTQLLDGILDSIFVLIGLGVSLGLPLKEGWEEICRSNMSKIDPKTGKVLRRASDGKILKPDCYSPPDLKKVLNDAYKDKNHLQAI